MDETRDPEVVGENNVGDPVVDAMTSAEVLVFWIPPSDGHVQALVQLSTKFVIDLNKSFGCGELVLFLLDPDHCHSIYSSCQTVVFDCRPFLLWQFSLKRTNYHRISSDRRTNDEAGHRQVPVFLVRFCF